jgi:hypothetical protein
MKELNCGEWLCFHSGVTDIDAIWRFKQKFGHEPDRLIRYQHILWCGPTESTPVAAGVQDCSDVWDQGELK